MKHYAIVLLAAVLGVGQVVAAEPSSILYDVTFDAPHRVGEPPAVDGKSPPRRGPSGVRSGEPTVVESVCSLTDRPLRLDWVGNYMHLETVVFRIPGQYSRHRIRLDVCVDELAPGYEGQLEGTSGLTIALQSRRLLSLRFLPNGEIRVQAVDGTYPPPGQLVGTFRPKETYRVEIEVDGLAEHTTVTIDGVQKLTIGHGKGHLRVVSVSIMDIQRGLSAAGVDNIRIEGFAWKNWKNSPQSP